MESTKLISKLIYDRLHRFLHAWIGIVILLLLGTAFYATSTENTFNKMIAWQFHIHMGYLLVLGLSARVIWGLFGTYYARWSELLHPKLWWNAISLKIIHVKWGWGHHPFASPLYFLFYFSQVFMIITGVFLAGIYYNEGLAKSFFDNFIYEKTFASIHAFFAWFFVGFIFLHLAGILFHERTEKIPIKQSMFSGKQYRKRERKDD